MSGYRQELQRHNEPVRRVARFFDNADGVVDEGFQSFAMFLLQNLPDSAEVNVALRKLLECRDAAHRAELGPDPDRPW